MKAKMLATAVVLLVATTAAAQEHVPLTAAQEKMARENVATYFAQRVPIEGKIVTGAPYSAEVVTETIQVLADGNRIVQRSTGRVYRDSQGRVRREEDAEPGRVGGILITDPVAGVSYSLDPGTRTAMKTPGHVSGRVMKQIAPVDPSELERRRKVEEEVVRMREAEMQHAQALKVPHVSGGVITPLTEHAPWDEKTEKLPARNIEGVMAEGTRTTRTIPAGAIGNEQPIVSMTEQWRSPDLQVLVLTRTSDPRSGETTYRLQNIVRGEQGRSWFEVPADYTVRESGIRRLVPTMK